MRIPAPSILRMCAVLGFGAWLTWNVAAETRTKTAKADSAMIRFDVPGGESVFALSLRARIPESTGPRDVAIVVDTSASQAGEYRRQTLAVLDSCLASLNPADRVRLFAIDTQVKSLSADFSAPRSAETKAALAVLQRRVPLGATNLQLALEAVRRSFPRDRPRAVLYIGDGMSTGQLIEWTNFRTLIDEFRREQIPVSSYAIGPRTDLQVLGILAQHTGGVVMIDSLHVAEKLSPEQLGRKLAQAAEAAVFYPDVLTLNTAAVQLLPDLVPPIRADRDTVVLGSGTIGDSLRLTATSGDWSQSWVIQPDGAQPGNVFLSQLWQQAEQSDGLLVPTAGTELLNVAREEFVVRGQKRYHVRGQNGAMWWVAE